MINSRIKAFAVTGFFCLMLGVSLLWKNPQWQTGLPLIIFYLVLTLNTYFSIKLFSTLIPEENFGQHLIDIILVINYSGLAFAITNALLFAIGVIFLFTIATLKYLFLLPHLPHPRLLKRKILIDIGGIILGLAALVGIIIGYSSYSTWGMAILFTLANILLLFIRPMYRLDN